MTIVEHLKKAKDELLTRGWYQGDYVNPVTGEVCIMGAVNAADQGAEPRCLDDDCDDTPIELLLHGLAVRHWCRDVAEFNDAKGRTPEEALAFLDEAIALAILQESHVQAVGALLG